MIETPRLRLRGWLPEDVEPWAAMNADVKVMEYFVEPTPRERSYEQAARMGADLERRRFGWFVLELKEKPGFGGIIAIDDIPWDTPFQPRREIGWRLPVEMWGKGYATEGARAALHYAFDTPKWPELVAMTAAKNERSRRVMERLGMTRDAGDDFEHPRVPLGHPIRSHVLYRITSSAALGMTTR
jgi:RimJ/RimL family protein N-acetyltransferase